jgi:hypothetical protein
LLVSLRIPLQALAFLLAAASAAAQDALPAARPAVQAVRMQPGETVRLDGRLDDDVWRRAPVATGFRQREPAEGAPATEQTEVRIAFDDETLYIAVLARDSEPDRIVSRILQRGRIMERGFGGRAGFAGDDAVAILVDPFHDRRNAVVFATNANGAEFDALLTDEGREFNRDWRGVWRVATARSAEGWSAEFAIPFRTLRYPDGGPGTWGFNVYRVVQRKNEESLWSGWSRDNEGFHRVSRAGRLEGMIELPRPARSLELKPYALGGATAEAAPGARAAGAPRLDVGLDAKLEPAPGLILDLTLNTDFAQVEADDQQINLTRFSLFFPEKRDFFLENAGIFEFGQSGGGGFGGPPFLLFFSRRIGIASAGEVPVLGGARLTGRAGAQTLGLLNVTTGRAHGEPVTNFAVARVKRDAGQSGYVGAMLTDRRGVTAAGAPNTAAGVDWSLWPTARLNLLGHLAGTRTAAGGAPFQHDPVAPAIPEEDGARTGAAYRLALDYTSDAFGFLVAGSGISPDTDAGTGFVNRTDLRAFDGFWRFSFRPAGAAVRRVDLTLAGNWIGRWDGAFQDRSGGPGATVYFPQGGQLRVGARRDLARLDEPFLLAGRLPVPAGDHAGGEVSASASTAASRPVQLQLRAGRREAWGGTIADAGGSLRLAPGRHLNLHAGYSRNRVELPAGAFTAGLASLRATVAFSTRAAAAALLQYNTLDESLSANLRFHLVHRPGSDLYLVLNETRGAVQPAGRPVARGAVLKATWLLRP